MVLGFKVTGHCLGETQVIETKSWDDVMNCLKTWEKSLDGMNGEEFKIETIHMEE